MTITALFAAFCKRMREEVRQGSSRWYASESWRICEGVVSVKNSLSGSENDPALVPWVTGVIAGTAVNKSAHQHDLMTVSTPST
ncbi:MAG: hypothetical protein ACLUNZ_13835 [Evtepia sp.]